MASDTERYDKMDVIDGLVHQLVLDIAEQGGVDSKRLDWNIEIIGVLRDEAIQYLLDKRLIGNYHDVYPCCKEEEREPYDPERAAAAARELAAMDWS